MHLVILILLILFVIAFVAGRFTPQNPYPWLADAIGALLLICVTFAVLGYYTHA